MKTKPILNYEGKEISNWHKDDLLMCNHEKFQSMSLGSKHKNKKNNAWSQVNCWTLYKSMNTLAMLRAVLPVTHDYYHWLLQLVSVFIYAYISSYAHHREHLKAFANSCKHYKINEHSRNTSGLLSVTLDHYHWLLLHLNVPLFRTRAIVNT